MLTVRSKQRFRELAECFMGAVSRPKVMIMQGTSRWMLLPWIELLCIALGGFTFILI